MTNEVKPLNCTIEEKSGEPLKVAESFTVHCLGPVPQNLKSSLLVVDPPADKGPTHVLRIKEILNKSENSLDLKAVSYRPGNHTDILVKVTDGENEFEMSGLSFTVNSVLKPNEQAQMEPSIGPFVLGFPISFYLTILILLVVLVVASVVAYGRRKLIKIREKEMTNLLVSEDCGKVFHRECRKLTKEPDSAKRLASLETEVRNYLVRRMFVPAQLPKMDLALVMIRKNHKEVHQHCGVLIRKIVGEFQKAKGKNLTSEDFEQLLRESRHVVDEIEKWHGREGAGK